MIYIINIMSWIYFFVFGLISSLIGFSWTIPFIMFIPFKIRLYRITSEKSIRAIMKRIKKKSSVCLNNEDPEGFFIGKYYIGHINELSDDNMTPNIYLLSSEKKYKELTKCKEHDINDCEDIKIKSRITVYEREGNYEYLFYTKRKLNITKFIPRDEQQVIIDKIIENYQKNKVTTVYLHGKTGTGKTFITLLLAKHFRSDYCKSFNPSEPGDTLSKIYGRMKVSENCPGIISLEEADRIIDAIHNQKINKHKNIPIQTYDKSGWNMLLDDINLGFYPNLIFILTSNLSPDVINSWDPSYLREKRINLVFELKDKS